MVVPQGLGLTTVVMSHVLFLLSVVFDVVVISQANQLKTNELRDSGVMFEKCLHVYKLGTDCKPETRSKDVQIRSRRSRSRPDSSKNRPARLKAGCHEDPQPS